MARAEPRNVGPITELHKFKKLLPAIHAFNSLVLDEKTRWYSEKIGADYFGTRTEFENYMKKIHHKPMDFGTIRKNILNNKYKKSCSKLFHDMELVFKNAMIFNKEGDLWYIPANRLFTILQALKQKNAIQKEFAFKPCSDKCKTCPHCNNIMLPIKTITTKRCANANCSENISGQRMDCYVCHNHSDSARNFCKECVQKLCHKCFNWHSGRKCGGTKMKSNASKKGSNTSSNAAYKKYGWPVLKLQVPTKPNNIEAMTQFEKVKCNPILNGRIEIIIEQIKKFDSERHFFKKVEHAQYASIVRNPIHFGQILKRTKKNKYGTIGDLKRDIDLLWSNCYLFNGKPNPDDTTNAAFANWAADLQWSLEFYLTEFEKELRKQKWLRSEEGALSSTQSVSSTNYSHSTSHSSSKSKSTSKSSKKSKHKSKKKKKKKKDKKHDDHGTDAKHTNNAFTKKTSKHHSAATVKKSHLLPTKASASTLNKIKTNNYRISFKKKHANKQSLTAIAVANQHNASKKIATPKLVKNTNINNNNKKHMTINDDDDSSISSTDEEDNNKTQEPGRNPIDINKLLKQNDSFFAMPSAAQPITQSIDTTKKAHHHNKKKKKRNRPTYDVSDSENDDNDNKYASNRHISKKARIAPSSSPPLSAISISSTDPNQAPAIPLTPTNVHTHIPQKRKFDNSHFEFNNNSTIDAPPTKKRKITPSDTVYGINNAIHNNVNQMPANMMNNNSVHYQYHPSHQSVNSVISHSHTQHSLNNLNTIHTHNGIYPSSNHHQMHHSTAPSVVDVVEVDPSIKAGSMTSHQSPSTHLNHSNHSHIHSPSTTYNPTISDISDYRLAPNDARSVIHSTHPSMQHALISSPHTTHSAYNMMRPQQFMSQSYSAATPQQLFVQQPPYASLQSLHPNQFDPRSQLQISPNHHPSRSVAVHNVQNTSAPNSAKRNKIKKLKLKRSSGISAPNSAYASIEPLEYHLSMAEKLMGVRPSTNAEATVYSNMPTNAGSLRANTSNPTPPMMNPTYAEQIIVNNNNCNPQQSTVTTSTSSSINSQQHIQTLPSTQYSNEYNVDHSRIIEKIIKGIYSKSISLEDQDRHHPAKQFETKDKFPQLAGIRAIAIFDIHQKLADDKNAYKALWEAYYDFAYIWRTQIHYNTDVRDVAHEFGKYVDGIFNNVLEDEDVFEKMKRKAHEELNKLFKTEDRRIYNRSAQASVTGSVGTCATIAYKHAERLFPNTKAVKVNTHKYVAQMMTNANIVPIHSSVMPNIKAMNRVTSNRTDDSELKPILSGVRATHVSDSQFVDASISPVVESASIAHNDKISVASHSSKTSKSSKSSRISSHHSHESNTIESVANNNHVSIAVQSVLSNSTISSQHKHKSKDKKSKESKKKKKKEKRDKKKKKKEKEKEKKSKKKSDSKSKKITLKHRPSSMKTRASSLKTRPSILKTRPKPIPKAVIPKVATNIREIKTKPKAIPTTPAVINRNNIHKSNRIKLELSSQSPPPPSILIQKMHEMSDSESIMDASPFLKPNETQRTQTLTVSFAENQSQMDPIPSPPTFTFDDDNCSINTTMTMGLNGRNADDLMGDIKKKANPFMRNKTMNNHKSQHNEEKTNKDFASNDDIDIDNEPFNFTKIPKKIDNEPFLLTKIPKKTELLPIQEETLKIAIDSDDDSVDEQLQEAHKQALEQQERRQKEKQAKEKEVRERQIREKAAREKAIKEKAAKEKAIKEKVAKEKAIKEKTAKEAKEKAAAAEILRKQQMMMNNAKKQNKTQHIEKKSKSSHTVKKKRIKLSLKKRQISTGSVTSTNSVTPQTSAIHQNTVKTAAIPLIPTRSIQAKTIQQTQVLPPIQSVINIKPKQIRPEIDRSPCFGDHVLKQQRVLRVYHEFKRTATGKIFDNENEIKGRYGINVSQLIEHNTFALRLIPFLIERQEFVNLPQDLDEFCSRLFNLAQKQALFLATQSRNQEVNILSAKFAKYHFDLLYKCYALNPDYEWRQKYASIDADFTGKKWVSLLDKLKEKCINEHYMQLFQAFDPSIRIEDDAALYCAAIRLWNGANDADGNDADANRKTVTLYEVELKLRSQLYTNNMSIKQDIQSALDNLQEIFHENERYRKFIAKLRNDWIDFKTEFSTDNHEKDTRETLGAHYSIFDTIADCVQYFDKQKTEKQQSLAQQLKVEKIIEDRIINTKYEGDCSFFHVQYKDFPQDMIWEPRIYMLRYYREDTKQYIRNKKKAHLDILLTHPDDLHAHKAFLNEKAGWIPRYKEQFTPIEPIPHQLRQEINRIAARKSAQLRKIAKEKRQRKQCKVQQQEDEAKHKDNDSTQNNAHFWKELEQTSSSQHESSLKPQSNLMDQCSLSFSLNTNRKKHHHGNPLLEEDSDSDNDEAMDEILDNKESMNEILIDDDNKETMDEIDDILNDGILNDGILNDGILNDGILNDGNNNDYNPNDTDMSSMTLLPSQSSQSILSQMTHNTITTISSSSIPAATVSQAAASAAHNNMDIDDISSIKPLTVLTSALSNGSNDDDEDEYLSSLTIQQNAVSASLLPMPPALPKQILLHQL